MIVKRSLLATAALCALSMVFLTGRASAQAPDGFNNHVIALITGLDITATGVTDPLLNPTVDGTKVVGGAYTLSLDSNAQLWFVGEDQTKAGHTITEVQGFYEVFMVAPETAPSFSGYPTGWTPEDWTSGPGAFYGWRADGAANRVVPGGSAVGTFTFGDAYLASAGDPVYFGIHVGLGDTTVFSGGTGKAYLWASGGHWDAPEPAFFQMAGFLGLGGLGLLKLRRRRK